MMLILPNGVRYIANYLDSSAQEMLRDEIRNIIRKAPLFQPVMPGSGKAMSVKMSNCGELGWVTDQKHGYRYQSEHPVTGRPWPPIPPSILTIWNELSKYPHPPEACLINFYSQDAKMGLHQDRDEQNLNAPVLSISLGETCRFRVGETSRGGHTTSFKLKSGDVVILDGPSRMCFHGVDRIYPATSTLLAKGGRLNLTIRRVTNPRKIEKPCAN